VPVEGMDPMVRRQAKAINFGIIYGISAFGLARQLGISRGDAQGFITRYFEKFPGIKNYMADTIAFGRAHGYVQTLFGRKTHVPVINSKNPAERGFAERAAINAPIQGSAADVIRRAMIRMPAALADAGLGDVRMLLQVHDELVFEAPDAQVDAAIPVIRAIMSAAALPAVHICVPLDVDCRAGHSWAAAH
jgi:DNA polymerase I